MIPATVPSVILVMVIGLVIAIVVVVIFLLRLVALIKRALGLAYAVVLIIIPQCSI